MEPVESLRSCTRCERADPDLSNPARLLAGVAFTPASLSDQGASRARLIRIGYVPDELHEQEVLNFVDRILDPKRSSRFLSDFLALEKKVAYFGAINSLAQTLLKITSPGVPDFYQGTELWDLSLADPDKSRRTRRLPNSHGMAGLGKTSLQPQAAFGGVA